jgi:hypothetical protein
LGPGSAAHRFTLRRARDDNYKGDDGSAEIDPQ